MRTTHWAFSKFISIDFTLLPHWRSSGRSDFPTQSLVFPQQLRMLVQQLATSNSFMKIPGLLQRPASRSVDQCQVFIELGAATHLPFGPNFISIWHMTWSHFLWWLFQVLLCQPPHLQVFPCIPVYVHQWYGSENTTVRLSPAKKKKLCLRKWLLW